MILLICYSSSRASNPRIDENVTLWSALRVPARPSILRLPSAQFHRTRSHCRAGGRGRGPRRFVSGRWSSAISDRGAPDTLHPVSLKTFQAEDRGGELEDSAPGIFHITPSGKYQTDR